MYAPVRLLDQFGDALLAADADVAVAALLERCGGKRRRNLAGLRTAHPVCDGEERRVADVGVLVPAALAARIRVPDPLTELHDSNRRSVSPIRTTSPGASRRSRVSRIPLTQVA